MPLRTALRLEHDRIALGHVRRKGILRVAGLWGADSLEKRIRVTVFAQISVRPLIDAIQQSFREIWRPLRFELDRARWWWLDTRGLDAGWLDAGWLIAHHRIEKRELVHVRVSRRGRWRP